MTVWSTDQFSASDRFGAWNEALSTTHLPWALARPRSPRFSAQLHALETKVMTIVQCQCDPCAGFRDRRTIRAGDDGMFGILMVHAGRERVCQDDKTADLRAGSTFIWDASQRVDFDVQTSLDKTTFLVSRDTLSRVSGQSDLPIGVIDSQRGFGALLHERAAALRDRIDEFTQPEAEQLGLSLLQDLINTTGLQNPQTIVPPRQHMIDRIKHVIDRNVFNPALTPALVADRAGISPRYLHLLFRDQGETVGARILRLRLEAVRNDLSDPANRHATITQICFARGFSGSAYMSRAFRARFGMSPRDYRNSQSRQMLQ